MFASVIILTAVLDGTDVREFELGAADPALVYRRKVSGRGTVAGGAVMTREMGEGRPVIVF